MRAYVAIAALVMIGGAAVVMKIGGERLAREAAVSTPAIERVAAPSGASKDPGPGTRRSEPSRPFVQSPDAASPAAASDAAPYERVEPRAPLSQLSLALPPKPPVDEDGGTILYRPVATGSARFEAMGRVVDVAGTESVDLRERCTFEGAEWPCGVRARTAFRYFIRGRAISCDVPPEAGTDIVAGCRIGAQDVGAWLVTNGWARAAPGGPYAEAEKQAREARRGIFGPPPKTEE
ncbi:thermonuclease family protein [Mesorhizobium sp. L-8-3]|uniref:thermonuclease family protein n=1 Tax=Mesorhizobium sp. L-8-3 TaxID=2744522 RepID=UPI001927F324|nr:thermonuclease family protein [Mesorhizobium sp. L-8-3]BCH27285.1 hypothetical protein MesoLjLb_70700 [Mesorhizobium sp. L-8-3]